MKNLINKLNKAAELYYNSGQSFLSDKEYDALLAQLDKMEKETGIVYPNSPTQKVGYEIISNIPKVKIEPIPMLSLRKVHTQKEIDDFANKKPIIGMVKCDGLSVRLIYKQGKLYSANSRGNGVEGGLITEHIKCFLNVPLAIPYSNDYIIDGEAIIKYNDFEIVSQNENLKNPRNAAAGSLNTLDLNIVKNRRLSFIAWDVIEGRNSNSFIENLKQAEQLGFEIVYYSSDEANEQILQKAEKLSIPCDGVVWKFDDIEYGKNLGATSHHFNNAIAWKASNETYETTLLDIEWQLSRTGQINPVAVFEEIEIDGTSVSKASLSNLSILQNTLNTPWRGQSINVSKRNQIIPKVESADIDTIPDDDSLYISMPAQCPVCGGRVIVRKDNDSEVLFCGNSNCEGKFLTSLTHFCSKNGLDIKGLSAATLEKLIDWGWVERFGDIFTLAGHRDEWIKKPGFGVASVDKALTAIEKASHCHLDAFISALGIPLIGRNTAKELVKHFPKWSDFINAIETNYPFYQLSGFGREISNSLLNYDYKEARYIAHNFITFIESETTIDKENIINGKTFVITGAVYNYKNRDELKTFIESLGGKVTGSVSNKTNYLINNDATSNSSKNLKAQSLGIPIITEEEFLKLL